MMHSESIRGKSSAKSGKNFIFDKVMINNIYDKMQLNKTDK